MIRYVGEPLGEIDESGETNLEPIFWELLEGALCNGWMSIAPEDIKALTSCQLIISEETYRDADNNVTFDGDTVVVYWHESYPVEDAGFELFVNGGLFLEKQEIYKD